MNGDPEVTGIVGGEADDPPPSEGDAGLPSWGYREVLVLLSVAVLAQMLAVLLAVAIAERLGASGTEQVEALLRREPLVAVPVQFLSWLPALAYIVIVVRVQYRLPLLEALSWTRPVRPVRSYIRTGMLLALASLVASVVIGDQGQNSPMQELFANRESLWILAGFGVLVAPVFEEVVFRGFLFAAFERAHGPWAALLVTSGVFSALHGAQYGWQWQQLVVLMAVGCAFGGIRMQSGSVMASTIVHAAYNGLLFLALVSFQGGLG